MNPSTQGDPRGAGETYVWQPPGKPFAVHIPLNIIDRLSVELMRGYGANPKRSPELGGVLIGSILAGLTTIVRVDDFELVPCQYRRGPSYNFTEEDCGPFELAGTRPDGIGYFRTHTREGLSLAPEDIDLLNHFFAGPHTVALLVKPFATKVSQAGIFIRENGTFPATSLLEFPFRRQELTGQEPPARRSMMERRPRIRDLNPSAPGSLARSAEESGAGPMAARGVAPYPTQGTPMQGPSTMQSPSVPSAAPYNAPSYNAPPFSAPPFNATPQNAGYYAGPPHNPAADASLGLAPHMPSPARKRWMWLPLSVVFLLLGLGLGFQAALTYGSRPVNLSADDFSLALTITRTDQTLTVRWDRQAPAVRAAQRGVLEIEEASISKPVELDASQLQNGTLVYRNASDDVRFKLSVFPREGLSVTQTAEWRRQQ
jgi:hypothetical protein